MPEISRFFGIIIAMYYNEHNPPHFHAKYQEDEAQFNINTLEIIKGKLPSRAKALVLEWAADHRKELLENWELASRLNKLHSIDPLK